MFCSDKSENKLSEENIPLVFSFGQTEHSFGDYLVRTEHSFGDCLLSEQNTLLWLYSVRTEHSFGDCRLSEQNIPLVLSSVRTEHSFGDVFTFVRTEHS
jgi:hypothetical protein